MNTATLTPFAAHVAATHDPLAAQAIMDAMIVVQDATDKADRRRALFRDDDDLLCALDLAMFDARKALRAQLRLAGINPAVLEGIVS